MSQKSFEYVEVSIRLFKQLQENYHGNDPVTILWHQKCIAELEAALKEKREAKLGWTELGMLTITYKVPYKKRRYEVIEITIPRKKNRPFAFLDTENVDDFDFEENPSFLVDKNARYNLLMQQLAELRRRDFLKRQKEKHGQKR